MGAGITGPGMLFDVAGTAAVLEGCTDRFVADTAERALLTMRSVIPGLWHPLACIAGGGIALRWFRDQFYNVLRGEAQDLPDDLYAAMIAEAQNIPPGADGLFFSPHLGGRICPSAPQMRGAWLGFSWGHTQAHFVRAVLESVAYEYAYYLGILRRLIPDLDLIEARGGGGGARSALWNQIKADVLGVPYRALQGGEFGTWGAAMIAGKAAGMFADLAATAEAHVRPDGQTRIPNLKDHNQYREIVAKHIAWQLVLEKAFD